MYSSENFYKNRKKNLEDFLLWIYIFLLLLEIYSKYFFNTNSVQSHDIMTGFKMLVTKNYGGQLVKINFLNMYRLKIWGNPAIVKIRNSTGCPKNPPLRSYIFYTSLTSISSFAKFDKPVTFFAKWLKCADIHLILEFKKKLGKSSSFSKNPQKVFLFAQKR